MPDTHQLAYVGSPALASLFVQLLEEEGLTVEWTRPEETRSLSNFAQGVVVALAVEGTKDTLVAGVKTATAKFRGKFPRTTIRDETDPTTTDEEGTPDN